MTLEDALRLLTLPRVGRRRPGHGRRDRGHQRPVRPLHQEGHRQPLDRVRGAAVHHHPRRGAGDLRPAQDPPGPASQAPLPRARSRPGHRRRRSCSRRGVSGRTSPTGDQRVAAQGRHRRQPHLRAGGRAARRPPGGRAAGQEGRRPQGAPRRRRPRRRAWPRRRAVAKKAGPRKAGAKKAGVAKKAGGRRRRGVAKSRPAVPGATTPPLSLGRCHGPPDRPRGRRGLRQVDPGRLLAAALGAVLTREPGGTPTGEAIRALLLDPALPARHGPGRGAAAAGSEGPARRRGDPSGPRRRARRRLRPLRWVDPRLSGLRSGPAAAIAGPDVGVGGRRGDPRPRRALEVPAGRRRPAGGRTGPTVWRGRGRLLLPGGRGLRRPGRRRPDRWRVVDGEGRPTRWPAGWRRRLRPEPRRAAGGSGITEACGHHRWTPVANSMNTMRAAILQVHGSQVVAISRPQAFAAASGRAPDRR